MVEPVRLHSLARLRSDCALLAGLIRIAGRGRCGPQNQAQDRQAQAKPAELARSRPAHQPAGNRGDGEAEQAKHEKQDAEGVHVDVPGP